MNDWKKSAFEALDNIRAEIDASDEPTFFVGMFIGESDLLRERPMIFYSNTSSFRLSALVSYAGWRLALKNLESAA